MWSHLLKKSSIENFIYCAVLTVGRNKYFTVGAGMTTLFTKIKIKIPR